MQGARRGNGTNAAASLGLVLRCGIGTNAAAPLRAAPHGWLCRCPAPAPRIRHCRRPAHVRRSIGTNAAASPPYTSSTPSPQGIESTTISIRTRVTERDRCSSAYRLNTTLEYVLSDRAHAARQAPDPMLLLPCTVARRRQPASAAPRRWPGKRTEHLGTELLQSPHGGVQDEGRRHLRRLQL